MLKTNKTKTVTQRESPLLLNIHRGIPPGAPVLSEKLFNKML